MNKSRMQSFSSSVTGMLKNRCFRSNPQLCQSFAGFVPTCLKSFAGLKFRIYKYIYIYIYKISQIDEVKHSINGLFTVLIKYGVRND